MSVWLKRVKLRKIKSIETSYYLALSASVFNCDSGVSRCKFISAFCSYIYFYFFMLTVFWCMNCNELQVDLKIFAVTLQCWTSGVDGWSRSRSTGALLWGQSVSNSSIVSSTNAPHQVTETTRQPRSVVHGVISLLFLLTEPVSKNRHIGAVDKTSSSFSAHGKIGNFIIIHHSSLYREMGPWMLGGKVKLWLLSNTSYTSPFLHWTAVVSTPPIRLWLAATSLDSLSMVIK